MLFGYTAQIYFRPFDSFNFNLKCLKYISLIYKGRSKSMLKYSQEREYFYDCFHT